MVRKASRSSCERVIDAAIALAGERGWDSLRLYQVAERADLSLAAVRAEFRDLDAVANAWFGRALDEILAAPLGELADRPAPARLQAVMMRWFDALAPHRELVGQMLRAKLHPGHPHHWGALIFDLSRLVHWFLDGARIASVGRQRQLAEVGLTAIFLAALRVWLRDVDAGDRIGPYLDRRLAAADRWLARLVG
jgi:AcrR family transcriptional regulator